jgi:hypothetical protein
MTNTAPTLIGTFNDIRVFDCRNTTSQIGMKPGDMYVAEVLLQPQLYAMRINPHGRIVGIDSDLEAMQAFVDAVDYMIQADYDRNAIIWRPQVERAISKNFYRLLSKTLDQQQRQAVAA